MMDDPAVAILLHEYDSLRTEIMSRYSAESQVMGAGTAYFVALLTVSLSGAQISPLLLLLLITAAMVMLLVLYTLADIDVTRASWRIQEIEAEVNARAGQRLLVWETQWGMGGGLGRLFARRPKASI